MKQCPEFAVLRMSSKHVIKSVVEYAYAGAHVYVLCMGGAQMNLSENSFYTKHSEVQEHEFSEVQIC